MVWCTQPKQVVELDDAARITEANLLHCSLSSVNML